MPEELKTIPEVLADLRSENRRFSNSVAFAIADLIEAAWKREAEQIERIVRDAVVAYNGLYTCAPNDEAEREVVERAKIANAYLTAHGMAPEPFYYSKEEEPCL